MSNHFNIDDNMDTIKAACESLNGQAVQVGPFEIRVDVDEDYHLTFGGDELRGCGGVFAVIGFHRDFHIKPGELIAGFRVAAETYMETREHIQDCVKALSEVRAELRGADINPETPPSEEALDELDEIDREWIEDLVSEYQRIDGELDEAKKDLANLCERFHFEPLDLYIHSGIALGRSGAFSCPWDTSRGGALLLIDKQALPGELTDEVIDFWVNHVSDVAAGNAYQLSLCWAHNGEDVAGCGGFIGWDAEKSGMLEYVVDAMRHALESNLEGSFTVLRPDMTYGYINLQFAPDEELPEDLTLYARERGLIGQDDCLIVGTPATTCDLEGATVF